MPVQFLLTTWDVKTNQAAVDQVAKAIQVFLQMWSSWLPFWHRVQTLITISRVCVCVCVLQIPQQTDSYVEHRPAFSSLEAPTADFSQDWFLITLSLFASVKLQLASTSSQSVSATNVCTLVEEMDEPPTGRLGNSPESLSGACGFYFHLCK